MTDDEEILKEIEELQTKMKELEAALKAAEAGYKLLWDENDRLRAAFQLAQRENLKLHEELNNVRREWQADRDIIAGRVTRCKDEEELFRKLEEGGQT